MGCDVDLLLSLLVIPIIGDELDVTLISDTLTGERGGCGDSALFSITGTANVETFYVILDTPEKPHTENFTFSFSVSMEIVCTMLFV